MKAGKCLNDGERQQKLLQRVQCRQSCGEGGTARSRSGPAESRVSGRPRTFLTSSTCPRPASSACPAGCLLSRRLSSNCSSTSTSTCSRLALLGCGRRGVQPIRALGPGMWSAGEKPGCPGGERRASRNPPGCSVPARPARHPSLLRWARRRALTRGCHLWQQRRERATTLKQRRDWEGCGPRGRHQVQVYKHQAVYGPNLLELVWGKRGTRRHPPGLPR